MKPVDLGRQERSCVARWHGTASAYVRAGCRCPHAREARRKYEKRRREGRLPPVFVDGLPTTRRLQALAALGWSFEALGERLGGVTPQAVRHHASGRRPRVCRALERRVARLYEALSMTVGPSAISRRRALAKGWAPPLAWEGADIGSPSARPAVRRARGSHSQQQRKGEAA